MDRDYYRAVCTPMIWKEKKMVNLHLNFWVVLQREKGNRRSREWPPSTNLTDMFEM